MYTYIYIYIYTCIYTMCDHTMIHLYYIILFYTRSPLQDSRLFGPSPWNNLALIE